ncbi:MAG: DeoR/GlpR family DNA-binding transcription regulator [Clostridium sp.]
MIERHTRILDLVSENKKVEVNRLAELLNVSQVTIRKDLDILEERGLLSREHGYAVMKNVDDINNRMAVRYETKLEIAREAAKSVMNGETVMIESGSSCVLLAEQLAQTKKDVTIITNSVFIASYIRETGIGRVILLGGEYQKESQVMVGPLVRICAKEFYVDKLFVGTDGFVPDIGFTGGDMMRTEAMKSMAGSAKNVIILTDSSKFIKQGVVVQFKLSEVSCVYTDDGVSKEKMELLGAEGIEVRIAGKGRK